MSKPAELEEAEIVDTLAQRYGQHPDRVLTGDVSAYQRLVLLAAAYPERFLPEASPDA